MSYFFVTRGKKTKKAQTKPATGELCKTLVSTKLLAMHQIGDMHW